MQLKKESLLPQGIPEAVLGYQRFRRAAVAAVAEAKQRVWEEFSEAMEKDFRAVPKRFWKTARNLRRGKGGTIQAVYSKDGTLLTSAEEVIGRWREYFGDLLNPTQPPSVAETELEDDGVSSPISLGEVSAVVKQLHSGKAPGIDQIPPEILKALGVEGLSTWLSTSTLHGGQGR